MLIGYARVSTEDQKLDLQHDALSAVGCERIFDEKISATRSRLPVREELRQAVRAYLFLSRGDVILRPHQRVFALVFIKNAKGSGRIAITRLADAPDVDQIAMALLNLDRVILAHVHMAIGPHRNNPRRVRVPDKAYLLLESFKTLCGIFQRQDVIPSFGIIRRGMDDHTIVKLINIGKGSKIVLMIVVQFFSRPFNSFPRHIVKKTEIDVTQRRFVMIADQANVNFLSDNTGTFIRIRAVLS